MLFNWAPWSLLGVLSANVQGAFIQHYMACWWEKTLAARESCANHCRHCKIPEDNIGGDSWED